MADLAFGISKTAIQLVADKVRKAIKEEAEQWKTVERDLVFITGEFEMMQSFLDAVTEEHVKNKIVRTWVRQVRELSHDVEDNIDFVLHLDPTKKSWWLRLVPSCSWAGFEVPPPPVDEAVAETTLLRARVVDVSQRNIRYNLIVDSASKPILDHLVPVHKTAASSFDVLINAVKKSGPLDLAGLVATEETDLQVVSVCGMEGDLVKVAIVRKMYNDARIHKEFQCRAWVKLMHPFNALEFIRSMMTQFFTHSCQGQDEVIVGLDALEKMLQTIQGDLDLIKQFAQKVNTHRYLIVLEDVCAMVQWDAIRSYLPDRNKGSRIVVLTHHPVVASQCTGEPCRVSDLGEFSPGNTVRVYYKEDFQPDRVQSIGKPEQPHHPLFLGRDTEIDELFKKTQETRLISVWGMPGVGKSALIKALCDEKLRTNDQFNMHAWVNLSHPFNSTEFCRSLLESLHRESTFLKGKYPKALQADLINKCRDHLSEQVCLFVIDGVQSIEDWDWIKSNLIQFGDSRSCIIIITSEETVAKHCAGSIDGMYNVKSLHATAAMQLFEKAPEEEGWFQKLKERHISETTSLAEMMQQIIFKQRRMQEAKLFLSKCGGIPKVLVTVARYLASKPKDEIQQEMRRLSDNFMHELSTNPEFDSLRGLLAWMHSYLDACPHHLKKCMLYLSIFPQDIFIRRRRLIRRWVAEGYSRGTDSISMEKSAENIFDEVAALSIMQPVLLEATKVIGYQVNGFFREYIMSRPVEETIFFPVEVSALEGKGHGRLAIEGLGQHLAVARTRDDDQIVFASLDLSRLRSLTVFDSRLMSFYVSDRMRVLRVLDLENASQVQDHDLEQVGKLPPRLKFLSLRGQSEITRLPDSVGDLLQLQTLDIRDTKIATLPLFVIKLRKLQYIRAGKTVSWTDEADGSTPPSSSGPVVGSRSGGIELPREMKRLEALLTLGAVHVNTADGEAILKIIYSLPHLKKLEVSGISLGVGPLSLAYLEWNSHLESLSLQFERHNHVVGIPESLRSLKMYGHVEELPRNIDRAANLGKVTLQMTNGLLTAEVISQLGRLPSLLTLRLHVRKDQQDGELQFPTSFFSKLQVLEIACNSKLQVTFDEGAMEKLEQLKLHCLQGSEIKFSGLERPASLKQVWLLGSFDDALKEAVQQQLDMHRMIPAPKLEVRPSSSQASRS